jgi:hypothetical protein
VPAKVDGILLPEDQLALARLAPGEVWLVLLLSPTAPLYARLATACGNGACVRVPVEPLVVSIIAEASPPLRCVAEVTDIGRAEPGQVWARLAGDGAALVAQCLAPDLRP